jgi:hypothetical protein
MVFLVNVPVGVVALVAGQYLLPRSRERHPITAFDWAGMALLAAAVVAVLLALSGLSGLGLDAATAAGLLGCGAALGRVRTAGRAGGQPTGRVGPAARQAIAGRARRGVRRLPGAVFPATEGVRVPVGSRH